MSRRNSIIGVPVFPIAPKEVKFEEPKESKCGIKSLNTKIELLEEKINLLTARKICMCVDVKNELRTEQGKKNKEFDDKLVVLDEKLKHIIDS